MGRKREERAGGGGEGGEGGGWHLDLLLLLLILENLPVYLLALLLEILDTCQETRHFTSSQQRPPRCSRLGVCISQGVPRPTVSPAASSPWHHNPHMRLHRRLLLSSRAALECLFPSAMPPTLADGSAARTHLPKPRSSSPSPRPTLFKAADRPKYCGGTEPKRRRRGCLQHHAGENSRGVQRGGTARLQGPHCLDRGRRDPSPDCRVSVFFLLPTGSQHRVCPLGHARGTLRSGSNLTFDELVVVILQRCPLRCHSSRPYVVQTSKPVWVLAVAVGPTIRSCDLIFLRRAQRLEHWKPLSHLASLCAWEAGIQRGQASGNHPTRVSVQPRVE